MAKRNRDEAGGKKGSGANGEWLSKSQLAKRKKKLKKAARLAEEAAKASGQHIVTEKERRLLQQEQDDKDKQQREAEKKARKKARQQERAAAAAATAAENGEGEVVKPYKRNRRSKKGKTKGEKQAGEKRFVLFIGNLPFRTTADQVREFVNDDDGVTCVRMPVDKETNKPKGFAFVEFKDSRHLHRALGLHQTTFKDRKVNVELTAGGGGNSENRKAKVREANKRLAEERRRKAERSKSSSLE